jgi:hypothetical protein
MTTLLSTCSRKKNRRTRMNKLISVDRVKEIVDNTWFNEGDRMLQQALKYILFEALDTEPASELVGKAGGKMKYIIHKQKIINNNILLNVEFEGGYLTPETAWVNLVYFIDSELRRFGKDAAIIIDQMRKFEKEPKDE